MSSFTNSPLVAHTQISPNRTINRNHKIDTITIHCVVGQLSAETIGQIFTPSSAQASSNYGIGVDGRIGMYVEEKDRSWCSSNASNDHRAITIEVASDKTHPFAINQAAYNSLINLLADICKRNDINHLLWKADKNLVGQAEQQNITVHRWFANKACPGDYIYERLGQIASEVNDRLAIQEVDKNAPSPFAKLSWDKATNLKIFDGTNPANAITREQIAVILDRVGILDMAAAQRSQLGLD